MATTTPPSPSSHFSYGEPWRVLGDYPPDMGLRKWSPRRASTRHIAGRKAGTSCSSPKFLVSNISPSIERYLYWEFP